QGRHQGGLVQPPHRRTRPRGPGARRHGLWRRGPARRGVNAAPADVIGLAALGRMVFEGVDVVPVWDRLMARSRTAPEDAGAIMDLATLLLLTGQGEAGLRVQVQALELQKLFRRPAPDASTLKLLAIVTPGDLMANTPLEFLLEDGKAANIRALTRDGVAAAMAGASEVLAPVAARLNRDDLAAIAAGNCPPCAFPLLVRPIASHAGAGLAKLDEASALPAYLAEQAEDRFYVTPFVDYSGADGLYRKQRIVLIEGRPFICHMAVSEHWMVHYMNAGMTESAEKRAEEARFMADYATDFAAR